MEGVLKRWFGEVVETSKGFHFYYFGYDWIVTRAPIKVLYDGGYATEMGYRAEAYIPGDDSDPELVKEEMSIYDLLDSIEGTGRF